MVQKKKYLSFVIMMTLFLVLVTGIVTATSGYSSESTGNVGEQIRPASQTESRGVTTEQIRPANQQNLPTDGNNGYSPSEGSSYSSGSYSEPEPTNKVILNAVLNNTMLNTTTNATGSADLNLDTDTNALSYYVSYSDLSSNETATVIDFPGLIVNNETVAYNLPIGEQKSGIITVIEEVRNYLLNGNAIIKIKSLLFPSGEISGQINII